MIDFVVVYKTLNKLLRKVLNVANSIFTFSLYLYPKGSLFFFFYIYLRHRVNKMLEIVFIGFYAS